MKKIIISVFLISLSLSTYAKDKIILRNLGTVSAPHPNAVPTVTSDGDDVNLTCDSLINNVDIVIRDQYGNVMHQSTQTIGPNETTLYVPSTDGDSEKTTIDLYYDRKHLSGYFDE